MSTPAKPRRNGPVAGRVIAALLAGALGSGAAAAPGAAPAPRTFCEQRGGAVTETGDPRVFICCYQARALCVASNLGSRKSRLLHLPDGARGLVRRPSVASGR